LTIPKVGNFKSFQEYKKPADDNGYNNLYSKIENQIKNLLVSDKGIDDREQEIADIIYAVIDNSLKFDVSISNFKVLWEKGAISFKELELISQELDKFSTLKNAADFNQDNKISDSEYAAMKQALLLKGNAEDATEYIQDEKENSYDNLTANRVFKEKTNSEKGIRYYIDKYIDKLSNSEEYASTGLKNNVYDALVTLGYIQPISLNPNDDLYLILQESEYINEDGLPQNIFWFTEANEPSQNYSPTINQAITDFFSIEREKYSEAFDEFKQDFALSNDIKEFSDQIFLEKLASVLSETHSSPVKSAQKENIPEKQVPPPPTPTVQESNTEATISAYNETDKEIKDSQIKINGDNLEFYINPGDNLFQLAIWINQNNIFPSGENYSVQQLQAALVEQNGNTTLIQADDDKT
jgi:hypothetical protein